MGEKQELGQNFLAVEGTEPYAALAERRRAFVESRSGRSGVDGFVSGALRSLCARSAGKAVQSPSRFLLRQHTHTRPPP
jgi:hypothetical protein